MSLSPFDLGQILKTLNLPLYRFFERSGSEHYAQYPTLFSPKSASYILLTIFQKYFINL